MCANNSVRQSLEASRELFFSLSELQKLVEQENSCVSVVTTKRSISLMPLHLKDLKASIKELLKAKVNRYDVQLEGVILAHKNVKLMVNSTMLSDSRYFHLEYLADIYVFKPKVGNMLTGTVNKVTKQYVNILVHGIFNVTVYSSGGQDVGGLKIGCQAVVKVTALDYTGQLPFIKAAIISPGDDGETEETTPNLNKKKKKKKSRGYEEEQSSLIGVSQREEPSSLIGVSQRKEIVSILKNSPLRMIRQSSTELESQDAESSSTESSKARTQVDAPPTGQNIIETPRKQKKKKSKSHELGPDEKPSRKRKREEEDGSDTTSSKKKKKKDKHKDENIGGNEIAAKPPLDNTVQIQADESIFKAASSTPVLGPPPLPKKKKRKHSDRAEQSALAKSLQQLKMEEMSHVAEPMDTTLTVDAKGKSKSKKIKIKQEAAESHCSKDESFSIDADSQTSSGKKKKKKKKDQESALDELAKSMLSQALKTMKGEV